MTSMNNMMNTTTVGETRPEHHVHKADEPLPGARGGAPTADYSTSAMERLPSSAWEDTDTSKPSREVIGENLDHPDHPTKPQLAHSGSASGRNAFSAERPLNTEPHPDGGVAIEGGHHDDGMPMGKATTADKLIGKTQKVVGKVTHNPVMHEKGELRESGGKAAVTGDARALHD
ncbi:hypothetical protein B0H15DRAFT_500796 [Mycena belliarum]|uniref:Uncharacterized protein n=1 Tax=Mycena belliarum TaxID=1033014 RepID=A0AAD6XHM0_9AGAR|nr:hypothetical protein B0H15DRAFT_500796 [Mycena belliae]